MTTTETTQEVTTTENPFRLCKTGKFEYPAEDEKCPDWEKCVLGNEDEFAFDLLGKGMKPFKSPEERNSKYSALGQVFIGQPIKTLIWANFFLNLPKLNVMRILTTLEMMPEKCVG